LAQRRVIAFDGAASVIQIGNVVLQLSEQFIVGRCRTVKRPRPAGKGTANLVMGALLCWSDQPPAATLIARKSFNLKLRP
jgi:hypothetical protein